MLGFVVAWFQRAGRAQLRTSLVDREIFWTVIVGRRLLVDLSCGEPQEEHLWNVNLERNDDYDGANGDAAPAGVVHSQSSSCLGDDCRRGLIPQQVEGRSGMERWESAVSRYEEKSKNKMNDEIKLAGLEALVPKELEKHLILNSNRLRTFEDL